MSSIGDQELQENKIGLEEVNTPGKIEFTPT